MSNKSSSYINDIPIVSGGIKLTEAILFMFTVITLAGQYQMLGNHEVTLQHTKKSQHYRDLSPIPLLN